MSQKRTEGVGEGRRSKREYGNGRREGKRLKVESEEGEEREKTRVEAFKGREREGIK